MGYWAIGGLGRLVVGAFYKTKTPQRSALAFGVFYQNIGDDLCDNKNA